MSWNCCGPCDLRTSPSNVRLFIGREQII
jgi:hypothetical protein